jgi:hypothetical protein
LKLDDPEMGDYFSEYAVFDDVVKETVQFKMEDASDEIRPIGS